MPVDARAQERLRNEIDVLKQCDHPNIVKLYDVIETKGTLYMIMEYVDGGDLVSLWHYADPTQVCVGRRGEDVCGR